MKKYIIVTLATILASALTPVQAFAVESFEQITQFLASIF